MGPQTDVDLATVTNGGWQLCYKSLYSRGTGPDIDAIRNTKCRGQNLMLACRQTDSTTIKLLAWADRDDVFHDANYQKNPSHIAQGSKWYFQKFYRVSSNILLVMEAVKTVTNIGVATFVRVL